METVELKAGRELDALVAEKVMGWNVAKDFAWDGRVAGWWNDKTHSHFNPSSDIASAWEVVEKLCAKDEHELEMYVAMGDVGARFIGDLEDMPAFDFAEAAPLAICLAALKAVS